MDDIVEKINTLRRELNAVILSHNYQRPEIQDIADYVGDSFGLSVQAMKIDSNIIIFSGVDFMAESAKVLNPEKKVILPNPEAKCPMAAMIDAEGLRRLKDEHPDAKVVAYVNTSAEVKAESDICCTSTNAVKVVRGVKEKKVIFVPDENLGLYIQRFVPDKEFIFWPGYCPTHADIKKEALLGLKELHPEAEIIVHPECRPEVIDIADHTYSTEGMINYARKSSSKEFIIGTEREHAYRLKRATGKTFYVPEKAVCPSMKKNELSDILRSLERLEPEVDLSHEVLEKAKVPLDRMVQIGRGD